MPWPQSTVRKAKKHRIHAAYLPHVALHELPKSTPAQSLCLIPANGQRNKPPTAGASGSTPEAAYSLHLRQMAEHKTRQKGFGFRGQKGFGRRGLLAQSVKRIRCSASLTCRPGRRAPHCILLASLADTPLRPAKTRRRWIGLMRSVAQVYVIFWVDQELCLEASW